MNRSTSKRAPSPLNGSQNLSQKRTNSPMLNPDLSNQLYTSLSKQVKPVAHPQPAQRHYVEAEYKSMAAEYSQHLQQEAEPPGPSAETILHEVAPMNGRRSQLGQQLNMSGQAASRPPLGGGGAGANPQQQGKNVPARVRAIQQVLHSQQQAQALAQQTQAGGGGGRPNSSSTGGGRPTSAGGTSMQTPSPSVYGGGGAQSTTTALSFEQELLEIERDTLGGAGGKASNGGIGKAAGKKSGGKTGASPVPNSFSDADATGGGGGFDTSIMDGLEVVDGAPSPFLDNPSVEEKETETKNTATGKPIYIPYTPDLRAKLNAASNSHTQLAPKPMTLRDYIVLAEACQRAGRARMEGHAYFKVAELNSKSKDTLPKAVVFFKKYLNISIRLHDLQGEAKALNCLGIAHYDMGGQVNYDTAIQYHKRHSEVADAAGVFIANTNLGLCHQKLGDMPSAMDCYQVALKFAVRAGDKGAEALALANLGATGTKHGDLTIARACVERHLELATTLQDNNATCEAYEQLGTLATRRGDFGAATENFLLALDVAIRSKNQVRARQLRCKVGYAQGMLRLEDNMKTTANAMGAGIA